MAEQRLDQISEVNSGEQILHASELAANELLEHYCKKTMLPIKGQEREYDSAVTNIRHALRAMSLGEDVIDSAILMGKKEVRDKLKIIRDAEAIQQREEFGVI